jgi:oxygen-independent coproporphyrinogen-3 oxidase
MNLYVHFPFCRRKCTYCALHSAAGAPLSRRAAYVQALTDGLTELPPLSTVYFGGGSPALCDLRPLFDRLAPALTPTTEFTVELHPLDVDDTLLKHLRDGGVNRISMGVQSLDDATLAHMARGYTFDEAERAFNAIRRLFDNAGIDLILGYPAPARGPHPRDDASRRRRLTDWGLRHCSVYSLILEEKSILHHLLRRQGASPQPTRGGHSLETREGHAPRPPAETLLLPDDDTVLDQIQSFSAFLHSIGLSRYEISNYATPGYECRHNLAVWRGEDYVGLGEGAHGRVGRWRTCHAWSVSLPETQGHAPSIPQRQAPSVSEEGGPLRRTEVEAVSEAFDRKERRLFRLRTTDGIDTEGFPEWRGILDRFTGEGLLTKHGPVYRLTERGTEVCDAILAELI